MRKPKDWDSVIVDMTRILQDRSKDPSTQVGCILVSPDHTRIAWGYNGMITGYPESEESWTRENKYPLVLHAEINAILNAKCDLTGWTLYVSIMPCKECAKYIAQANIKRVVYCKQHSSGSKLEYDFTRKIFCEAGIKLEKYTEPLNAE